MDDNNLEPDVDKLSMGLSVFIALCVVGLFCAISIVLLESVNTSFHEKHHKNPEKYLNLPNNKENMPAL